MEMTAGDMIRDLFNSLIFKSGFIVWLIAFLMLFNIIRFVSKPNKRITDSEIVNDLKDILGDIRDLRSQLKEMETEESDMGEERRNTSWGVMTDMLRGRRDIVDDMPSDKHKKKKKKSAHEKKSKPAHAVNGSDYGDMESADLSALEVGNPIDCDADTDKLLGINDSYKRKLGVDDDSYLETLGLSKESSQDEELVGVM